MTGPDGLADRGPLGVYSDAARRMSDEITLALIADRDGTAGKFMAFRLSDGGTDGVRYDRGSDAARYQLHPKQCVYLQIDRAGLGARGCAVMLETARRMYDSNRYDPLAAMERMEAMGR